MFWNCDYQTNQWTEGRKEGHKATVTPSFWLIKDVSIWWSKYIQRAHNGRKRSCWTKHGALQHLKFEQGRIIIIIPSTKEEKGRMQIQKAQCFKKGGETVGENRDMELSMMEVPGKLKSLSPEFTFVIALILLYYL